MKSNFPPTRRSFWLAALRFLPPSPGCFLVGFLATLWTPFVGNYYCLKTRSNPTLDWDQALLYLKDLLIHPGAFVLVSTELPNAPLRPGCPFWHGGVPSSVPCIRKCRTYSSTLIIDLRSNLCHIDTKIAANCGYCGFNRDDRQSQARPTRQIFKKEDWRWFSNIHQLFPVWQVQGHS